MNPIMSFTSYQDSKNPVTSKLDREFKLECFCGVNVPGGDGRPRDTAFQADGKACGKWESLVKILSLKIAVRVAL